MVVRIPCLALAETVGEIAAVVVHIPCQPLAVAAAAQSSAAAAVHIPCQLAVVAEAAQSSAVSVHMLSQLVGVATAGTVFVQSFAADIDYDASCALLVPHRVFLFDVVSAVLPESEFWTIVDSGFSVFRCKFRSWDSATSV